MATKRKKPRKTEGRRGASADPARARATPDEVERQIAEIEDLMARAMWNPAKAGELADRWGTTVSTVRKRSAEASRRVHASLGTTREEVIGRTLPQLEQGMAMALAEGDYSGMASLGKLVVQITGAAAPTKVAVTDTKGNDVPTWLQNVDPRLVLAFVAEHGRPPTSGELEGLRAQGPAKAAG